MLIVCRDGLLFCLAQLPSRGLPVVSDDGAFDPRRQIEPQISSQRKCIRLIKSAQASQLFHGFVAIGHYKPLSVQALTQLIQCFGEKAVDLFFLNR